MVLIIRKTSKIDRSLRIEFSVLFWQLFSIGTRCNQVAANVCIQIVGMGFAVPPLKHERTTFERLEKFISGTHFLDCNLKGRLYGSQGQIESIEVITCGQSRVSFEEAKCRFESCSILETVQCGFKFGPAWSTTWFRCVVKIPSKWATQRIHLVWDSECEAMLWSEDGSPLIGLSAEVNRTDFCLTTAFDPQSHPKRSVFYIEAAGNLMFGSGRGDQINPPDSNRHFELKTAKIAVFNEPVYQLLIDFEVAIDLIKSLPESDPKRFELLYLANNAVNQCQMRQFSDDSIESARNAFSTYFYSEASDRKDFTVHAVANCHIDSAWLWPFAETKRKCARSWSNVIALMEQYDTLNFACSQAQQLQWVKDNYPLLFERIREKAITGRFIMVGGSWVEMDGNLPGGESVVRQMLYGQRFFRENFGSYCDVFWLPDTFGYSPQLPQITTLSGMRRFVTQKLSWNLVNKFPHSTFWWRGLDGTRLLTHFPPADSYCSRVSAEELLKSFQSFKDKGRSKHALLLYGFGDGGGGPDRDMLERMRRLNTSVHSALLQPSSPDKFLEAVEKEIHDSQKSATDKETSGNDSNVRFCTWDGELYLELHNGTYTTQARAKQYNRKLEFLLRDVEFLTVLEHLGILDRSKIRTRDWSREWKCILLNQFHDVLPGTSIGAVYEDANRIYAKVEETCDKYLNPLKSSSDYQNALFLNSMPWERSFMLNNCAYSLAPMSLTPFSALTQINMEKPKFCVVEQSGNFITMKNQYVEVEMNQYGHVTKMKLSEQFVKSTDNIDFIPVGQSANVFVIFDDVPLYWDAWDIMDYYIETRQPQETCIDKPHIMPDSNESIVRVAFSKSIGARSTLKQTISLQYDEPYVKFSSVVDWHESHKMLKVEFPVDVRSTYATYETQFGHLSRPCHQNTSWDWARFEVCAQKWADLSEYDRGLAVINDCKYGYSCLDNVLSLSLLRSPKAPDPMADMESHEFTYALMPHAGPFQNPSSSPWNVLQSAYNLNSPIRCCKPEIRFSSDDTFIGFKPLFRLDKKSIIIESVKLAENYISGEYDVTGIVVVVIRLYESWGSKTNSKLFVLGHAALQEACCCNILEDNDSELIVVPTTANEYTLSLTFRPFEIKTIKLTFRV